MGILELIGSAVLLLWIAGPEQGSSTFHAPDSTSLFKIFLRWAHFVAGITWIGLLYFFNLVNVPFMQRLDPPTRSRVVPILMPRALWFFRWGAIITVLVGLTYYAMYILHTEARNAGIGTWRTLFTWLAIVVVTWGVIYALLQPVSGALNKGPVLAAIVIVLIVAMSWLIIRVLGAPGPMGETLGNKSLSIGLGGGYGIIMLLNVWGVIWRAQKRIIAWTKESAEQGTPMPPESAKLARRAFLASRMNAWLSLPMLFFMGTSHGDYIWFAK
jgi:uncharacterized membrane protein